MRKSVHCSSLLLLLTACAANQPTTPQAGPALTQAPPSKGSPAQTGNPLTAAPLSDLPAPVRDSQAVEADAARPTQTAQGPGAASLASMDSAGATSAPFPQAQPQEQGTLASAGAGAGQSSSAATGSPGFQASPLEPRGLSAPELSLWSDPAFLLRFTNSYLPDTAIEPTPSDEELLTLAEVAELMGDDKLPKALALLEKNRKKESSAVLDCYLANLYFQQERLPEAIAGYRDAVAKFPKFKRAWSNLALASIRQEDYSAGMQAAVRTLELGGGSGDLYGLLGLCHMQLENYVAAESAYRLANLLEPGRLEWELGMANAFVRQQRFQEAGALFGAMIARQPDQANLWAQQAKTFLALGQPQKAAENLEVVLALGSGDADTLALLGNIYINEGLTEMGADKYLRALELKRESLAGPTLNAARSILFKHDNSVDAERLLTALDPAVLPLDLQKERLNLMARISIDKDPDNIESAALLEQLIALDPTDGDALIRLAGSHRSSGNTEQALLYFERAGGMPAFEERAKLAHGQYLTQLDRGVEALPLLRRALELRRERNAAGLGKQEPVEQIEKLLAYVERKVQGRSGS